MSRGFEKNSFGTNEAAELIEKDPHMVDYLIARGIDRVHNFTSIGYLLNRQELESIECSDIVRESILKLLTAVITDKSTIFNVSVNAMENFSLHGNIIAPLVGTIYFPPDQRETYLQRFSKYLSEDYYGKIEIVTSDLSNIAVLCAKEFCLIYTTADSAGGEKIHIFKSKELCERMSRELFEDNRILTEFSPELWDIYLDRLGNSSNNTHM